METFTYAGYWTGRIEGTNQGGLTLDLKQDGELISGVAKISEPTLGQYEYIITGTGSENLSLPMKPGRQTEGILLGDIEVVCKLNTNNELVGRWVSTVGTEGTFNAKKFDSEQFVNALPKKNSVFLVHGQDNGAKYSVARFLEQIGITPVILHEQMNQGMTIIEKFETYAKRAGCAIILMTPDDLGYKDGTPESIKHRARQNVVLELGYFTALLGRDKVIVLKKGDIEMPSDFLAVVYQSMDDNDGWKMHLAKELKIAGFEVDMNKTIF